MGILKDSGEPEDVGRLQVRFELVAPADWRELRSVRLRALADAPKAFTSEHSQEADWLEQDWRSAIQQGQWVVARSAQGAIGVARSSQDPESPERRYIEAVWIAPEFRRLGIGRRLMRWLIERERKSGVREILLWVMDSNASARGFYFRTGFRSTGRIQPVPGQENRTEELLSFVVGRWGLRER